MRHVNRLSRCLEVVFKSTVGKISSTGMDLNMMVCMLASDQKSHSTVGVDVENC